MSLRCCSIRAGMTDLHALTLIDAAAAIRSGSLSSVDLVQALLQTIDDTEPAVHAYAFVNAEQALEHAAAADRALAAGNDAGPLHGLPIAAKDLIWTDEMPTTAGSAVLQDWIAPGDATVVSRLRDSGAVILGKTVSHEFGASQNEPPTRNAWKATHFPGGSSAGAGVAVALGSALAALGSDSGGSTRKPSSLNGVVGVKPTYGRVSRHGVIYSGSSMDQVGPITRRVADAAFLLEILSGFDPHDPSSIDAPLPSFLEHIGEGVDGLRLGVADYFFDEGLDPEVRSVAETAIAALEQLGAELVEVSLPALSVAAPAGYTILMVEQAAFHQQWITHPREREYEPETRWLLAAGSLIPAMHYQAANRARALMKAEMAATFGALRIDALVGPTLPSPALAVEAVDNPTHVPDYVRYTVVANLTGQPAISVPCGFSDEGLPIGLQLIGKPFDEGTLFRIAAAYESASSWFERRPPLVTAQAGG